ncbi:MAG: 4'-phosphopantetheinyl transferase superfamily protein [Bdellovibrionota bacterium]|nr:4'-phosphopantetheinyl transferase superfamily protein [Bdellovibrionota bacterium]
MDVVYQIIDKRNYTHAKLATSFLCPRDQHHLEGLESIGKKFDFVLGRNLLKNFLEKYCLQNFETLDLNFSSNGKPYLKDQRFFFNMAHSGNYIIVVASSNPCGVDLQREESLDRPEYLWERIAHEEELYQHLDASPHFILKTWTQKEAVTKCFDHTDTGSFSSINLSNLRDTRSIAWHHEHFFLKSIPLSDSKQNYFCEIASIGKKYDHPIDLHEVNFFGANG